MVRIITRKEVAELAGVSEATVSRVFNDVGPMKEETKQRVLQAAKKLNYHPNAIAQSFARRRSGNLGVVLPYVPKVHIFSTYYFSEILSGIGAQVKESGYDMLLMLRSPGEESDYVRMFRSQKVDACIILGAMDTPGERAELKKLEEGGFPFCLVNQHYVGERFNEVDADHETGSYLAVRYLLNLGYRGIAILGGSPQFSNSVDRLRGYTRAMREAGLLEPGTEAGTREGIPPYWYYEGNYSRTSGYHAAAELHRNLDRVDAVFVSNDRMAVGLMQGLRELGCNPGKDLAIIGYDDSDAARMTDPPLTSVAVPFYELGRLAAENVLHLAAGGSESNTAAAADSFQLKLDTKLVIRQSCRNKS
ncbi:LacI family DNA-binding transcriptional regulator [Paenibacillus sp. PvR098]|uniref:LacI family DNA-binding transcriptional regulator n=1 Tax=unclassified Paenibacillus TaxID=185978 RepID=UPI0032AF757F